MQTKFKSLRKFWWRKRSLNRRIPSFTWHASCFSEFSLVTRLLLFSSHARVPLVFFVVLSILAVKKYCNVESQCLLPWIYWKCFGFFKNQSFKFSHMTGDTFCRTTNNGEFRSGQKTRWLARQNYRFSHNLRGAQNPPLCLRVAGAHTLDRARRSLRTPPPLAWFWNTKTVSARWSTICLHVVLAL